MPISRDEIKTRAARFAASHWKDETSEQKRANGFIREFLNVFGIDQADDIGCFENAALREKGHGRMDYFAPRMIVIEMKSRGANLDDALKQLQDYVLHLPADQITDHLMVSDFENILYFHRTTAIKKVFLTKDLLQHIHLFSHLAGFDIPVREDTITVNVQAAEKMAKLHDALYKIGYKGHALEVYLVRLLFCMFANDTLIFPKDAFLRYVQSSAESGIDLCSRLYRLFKILNTPDNERGVHTGGELAEFLYINGGLFEEDLPLEEFDKNMRSALLECMANFDWSEVSPAVFGSMFQGVMDANARRELGAHYTSEENILKLINPLFMDALRAEFAKAKNSPAKLDALHDTISRLKFLDPACGCGNFLIIAYRELRLLEMEIIKKKIPKAHTGQLHLDIAPLRKVSIEQFFGIELEDFPCQIARAGLWLTEHQMNQRLSAEYGVNFAQFPLGKGARIVCGNALRMDWASIVPRDALAYIMGNPPFVGSKFMSDEQREDIGNTILNEKGEQTKGAGVVDYVAAWYYKAAQFMYARMQGALCAAFVSTNSITQGEQVAAVWKPLFEKFGICIHFAWRTFKWSNEAKGKAAVHCVIIGFGTGANGEKVIFDSDEKIAAKNINPYLVDAVDVFIESRGTPLCAVPDTGIGNKPIDGGNYLFTEEEKNEFLRKEPQAEKWFRPWIGSDEFINGYRRYCLWLGDCSPAELKQMPEAMKRIEAVRQFRLASKSAPTRKIADTPRRFHVENMPNTDYIVVPRVSSEKRRYIPIGFISPDILASDAVHIIPNAALYHFGILTSSVHMAWVRVVCGRLEMRYRYSKDIVYNNFPWP
ncbi:MAG: class I SAM-dependent DNA methyltransferase, partial [Spirochaetota bacterium]|nr:class I SAM-dependent DNA methyltransferase [Spirochaetota bacterium]